MADHVLVIDDDAQIAGAIRESLAFEGYRVRIARNGVEALAEVAADPPSLILLDMRMPVMNGWEFAARLAELDVRSPVVVMTAAASAASWAAEVNADDVLPKPFTLKALFDTVARWRPAQ